MFEALMIKTKDGREFLTPEKNLNTLIEYAKTFHAQIFKVNVVHGKLLDLKKLAVAVCDPDYKSDIKADILERVFPRSIRNRKHIIDGATNIKKFVKQNFIKGNAVSLKLLKERYEYMGVTDACLSNHLNSVRKSLMKEGNKFVKLDSGTYVMVTE